MAENRELDALDVNQPKESHQPDPRPSRLGVVLLGTDFRHAVEFSRSGRAENLASRPSSSACVVLLGVRARPRGRPRRREKVTWLWLGLSNRPLVTRATRRQPRRNAVFTRAEGPRRHLRRG